MSMFYLVRETTDVDSVYHVGIFRSFSDAQTFIDLYLAGEKPESCWKREIVSLEKLVEGFVPVEETGR